MDKRTIKYALLSLRNVANENDGVLFDSSEGSIHLHLASGNVIELSEKEIIYQATNYLESQIESLKN